MYLISKFQLLLNTCFYLYIIIKYLKHIQQAIIWPYNFFFSTNFFRQILINPYHYFPELIEFFYLILFIFLTMFPIYPNFSSSLNFHLNLKYFFSLHVLNAKLMILQNFNFKFADLTLLALWYYFTPYYCYYFNHFNSTPITNTHYFIIIFLLPHLLLG